MDFHIVKIYKDKVSTKISKILFLSMYDVKVSDIYFTEFGAALTTVLPVLFKYCYKYRYSDSRKL
jgi:transposase-like protein